MSVDRFEGMIPFPANSGNDAGEKIVRFSASVDLAHVAKIMPNPFIIVALVLVGYGFFNHHKDGSRNRYRD